jgi:hypothetical protein
VHQGRVSGEKKPMGRVELRTSILPAVQAVLTGGSTLLGVVLVCMWRPDRARHVPFYSDATHNDPERVILGIGENLACFLTPLVATVEFLHQSRVCETLTPPRPLAPKALRCILGCGVKTMDIVRLNGFVTACTSVFFFVTANVPSSWPFTPPHQIAASALIFMYAVQSTLKAILAATFNNYPTPGVGGVNPTKNSAILRAWERYHMMVRLTLSGMLWFALVSTWVCVMGRAHAHRFQSFLNVDAFQATLSTLMAVIVHIATVSCVTLMAVMAVDMRDDRIVLLSRGLSADCGGGGGVDEAKSVAYVSVRGCDKGDCVTEFSLPGNF